MDSTGKSIPVSPTPPQAGLLGRLAHFFLLSFGYVALRFVLNPVRSRLLTEQFSKELYGSLTLLTTTTTFLASLLALGSFEFLTRRLPGLSLPRQKGWFSLVVWRIGFPAWLVLALVAAAAKFLGYLSALSWPVLAVIWFAQGLTLFILYRAYFALGCGRIPALRLIQLFQNDLWFIGLLVGGAWAAASFEHSLWIWTAWLSLLVVAILVIGRRPAAPESPAAHGESLSNALRFGLPLVPMLCGEFLARQGDKLILLAHFPLTTSTAYTDYAFAYNIANIAYLIGVSLIELSIPHLYAATNARPSPTLVPDAAQRDLFSMMLRHVLSVGAILVLCLALLKDDVFAIIAAEEYRDIARFLPWTAPIALVNILHYTFSRALIAQNRTRTVGYAALGASILNILLNLVLVPVLAASAPNAIRAVAVANASTFFLLAILYAVLLRIHRWISLPMLAPHRFLLAILLSLATYLLIPRFIVGTALFSVLLRLATAGLATVLVLFLTRTFSLRDMSFLRPRQ